MGNNKDSKTKERFVLLELKSLNIMPNEYSIFLPSYYRDIIYYLNQQSKTAQKIMIQKNITSSTRFKRQNMYNKEEYREKFNVSSRLRQQEQQVATTTEISSTTNMNLYNLSQSFLNLNKNFALQNLIIDKNINNEEYLNQCIIVSFVYC